LAFSFLLPLGYAISYQAIFAQRLEKVKRAFAWKYEI
jgi:hypothetical protein